MAQRTYNASEKMDSLLTPEAFRLFMPKVQFGEGCWEWRGAKSQNRGKTKGYGKWWLPGQGKRGQALYTNRLMYCFSRRVTMSSIKELNILHECDNPPCVRPSHLRLGTMADNIVDMISKQRMHRGSARGMAKLNEQQAVEIRELQVLGISRKSIAVRFGVSESTIRALEEGRTWTHIQHASEIMRREKPVGSRVVTAKLNEAKVLEIKKLLQMGELQYKIAKQFSVSRYCIGSIARGISWKHVKVK
jgi:DNA-binding transcriptional regulator YiaG